MRDVVGLGSPVTSVAEPGTQAPGTVGYGAAALEVQHKPDPFPGGLGESLRQEFPEAGFPWSEG